MDFIKSCTKTKLYTEPFLTENIIRNDIKDFLVSTIDFLYQSLSLRTFHYLF
jgi:hypothetical protein